MFIDKLLTILKQADKLSNKVSSVCFHENTPSQQPHRQEEWEGLRPLGHLCVMGLASGGPGPRSLSAAPTLSPCLATPGFSYSWRDLTLASVNILALAFRLHPNSLSKEPPRGLFLRPESVYTPLCCALSKTGSKKRLTQALGPWLWAVGTRPSEALETSNTSRRALPGRDALALETPCGATHEVRPYVLTLSAGRAHTSQLTHISDWTNGLSSSF